MNILSMDTSTGACSVALLSQEGLVGEILINDKRTHSQKLMPILENLFNLGNFTMDDIDLLAVCIGPGSFTGLRIAMATVKSISHVRDIPIVGINSLEALASNLIDSKREIVPIIDAQGRQVYTSRYECKDGRLVELEEISFMTIEDRLENVDSDPIFIGEVSEKYRDEIRMAGCEVASFDRNVIRASTLAYIAKYKFENKIDVYNCYEILPQYIRKSQAEIQYEEKQRMLKDRTNEKK